ncbi:uncharacterized protein LOC141654893 [Silene latifolia]|uniref:uncharacterized protein LOC141654893 n=1 Tax=Silene latifolia TaxID=37657 RepID=UPI003D77A020
MAHMTKRDFDILDNNGTKYLQWRVDARANLKAKGLEHTILVDGNSTSQEQAKAIVFLRHHLHENLKIEYLFVEDPKELWDNLCQRFESLERIIGRKLDLDEYTIQDFTSLCGQATIDATMIEKTLSTMHADNAVLQELYRERHYNRYCDLIAILRMAEANMKVMFHNHNKRPAGLLLLLLKHMLLKRTTMAKFQKGNTTFHKGKGKWRPNFKPLNPIFKGKKKFTPNKGKPNQTTKCFKCASQKGKGKEVETNFVKETSPVLSLDLSDYLIDDIDNGCGPST